MRRIGREFRRWIWLVGFCLPLRLAAAEAPTPPVASPPAPAAPAGEATYVVKKGDTLWGIAKEVLKDPSLWRQIWERNPFITDPNRIFPGDTLALPGREPAPPAPVAEAPRPAPPRAAPPPPPVVAKAPPPASAPPKPAEELTPLPPVPPASQRAIACSPVLIPEEGTMAPGIGTIVRSDDNRLLLTQEDHAFVGLDGTQAVKVGDRLAVIRTGFRVIHPRTRKSHGRVLFTLGLLEVTEVRDRTVRSRVSYACDAIGMGDRVVPFALPPFPEGKAGQPATRPVEGTILDSPRAGETFALQHLVFLDVGTGQGIGPGDVFAILRPSASAVHPVTGALLPISPERLGEAVVIRVAEASSTAVVTASGKEIQPGDRVVLTRQIQR